MVWKPSEKEEEYFARLEFEKKKKIEEEKHKKLAVGLEVFSGLGIIVLLMADGAEYTKKKENAENDR